MLLFVGIAGLLLIVLPSGALFYEAFLRTAWAKSNAETIRHALRISLYTASISTGLIVISGTPLAFVLTRYDFWGKRLLSVVVELPIVMPPAVAGLALLITFGRNGFIGQFLNQEIGLTLPFTQWAVIMAQFFVAIPFYIRTVQVGFRSIPSILEDAARVDGATQWDIIRRIWIPLARHAIIAGMLLSWARALGEFGATILFAGNLEGRTQTLTLLVYASFERDIDAAIWTAVILLGIAAVAMILVRILLDSGENLLASNEN